MNLKSFSLLFIASVLLVGCAPTSQERQQNVQSRNELVADLTRISKASLSEKLNFLMPQCISSLQNQPVDETALSSAGFTKKKALIGGIYYIKVYSKAGIAKYQNADILSPNNGKNCSISNFLSSITAPLYPQTIEDVMLTNGFSRLDVGGGLSKKTPRYQRGELKIEISLVHSRDSQTSNVNMRLF